MTIKFRLEFFVFNIGKLYKWWCTMPLSRVNNCEFKGSLVFRASSRTSKVTEGYPVSKTKRYNFILLCFLPAMLKTCKIANCF